MTCVEALLAIRKITIVDSGLEKGMILLLK
jgi:hypothetical protein